MRYKEHRTKTKAPFPDMRFIEPRDQNPPRKCSETLSRAFQKWVG